MHGGSDQNEPQGTGARLSPGYFAPESSQQQSEPAEASHKKIPPPQPQPGTDGGSARAQRKMIWELDAWAVQTVDQPYKRAPLGPIPGPMVRCTESTQAERPADKVVQNRSAQEMRREQLATWRVEESAAVKVNLTRLEQAIKKCIERFEAQHGVLCSVANMLHVPLGNVVEAMKNLLADLNQYATRNQSTTKTKIDLVEDRIVALEAIWEVEKQQMHRMDEVANIVRIRKVWPLEDVAKLLMYDQLIDQLNTVVPGAPITMQREYMTRQLADMVIGIDSTRHAMFQFEKDVTQIKILKADQINLAELVVGSLPNLNGEGRRRDGIWAAWEAGSPQWDDQFVAAPKPSQVLTEEVVVIVA